MISNYPDIFQNSVDREKGKQRVEDFSKIKGLKMN